MACQGTCSLEHRGSSAPSPVERDRVVTLCVPSFKSSKQRGGVTPSHPHPQLLGPRALGPPTLTQLCTQAPTFTSSPALPPAICLLPAPHSAPQLSSSRPAKTRVGTHVCISGHVHNMVYFLYFNKTREKKEKKFNIYCRLYLPSILFYLSYIIAINF